MCITECFPILSSLRWSRDQQYSSKVSVTRCSHTEGRPLGLTCAGPGAGLQWSLWGSSSLGYSVILSPKTGLPVLLFAGLKLIHLQLTLHTDHCDEGHALRMLREWGCKGNEDVKGHIIKASTPWGHALWWNPSLTMKWGLCFVPSHHLFRTVRGQKQQFFQIY